MGLSQTTASEHIKTLGKELGAGFFARMGRRLFSTPKPGRFFRVHPEDIPGVDDARVAGEEVCPGSRNFRNIFPGLESDLSGDPPAPFGRQVFYTNKPF